MVEFVTGSPVLVAPFTVAPPVIVRAGVGGAASLWTGDGPPTTIVGSHPGDEYVDLITGDLYQLN